MSAMNADELDRSYTELSHAMTRVGEAKSTLFLAMMCLALMARQPSSDAVLAMIETAERQCV